MGSGLSLLISCIQDWLIYSGVQVSGFHSQNERFLAHPPKRINSKG